MYDEILQNTTIDDLNKKTIDISNTVVVLAEQGYIAGTKKQIKLDWSSILLHAFENIHILNKEQQSNVEQLYNTIYKL